MTHLPSGKIKILFRFFFCVCFKALCPKLSDINLQNVFILTIKAEFSSFMFFRFSAPHTPQRKSPCILQRCLMSEPPYRCVLTIFLGVLFQPGLHRSWQNCQPEYLMLGFWHSDTFFSLIILIETLVLSSSTQSSGADACMRNDVTELISQLTQIKPPLKQELKVYRLYKRFSVCVGAFLTEQKHFILFASLWPFIVSLSSVCVNSLLLSLFHT